MLFDEGTLNVFFFRKAAKKNFFVRKVVALEKSDELKKIIKFANMVNSEIIQNVQNVIATSKPE